MFFGIATIYFLKLLIKMCSELIPMLVDDPDYSKIFVSEYGLN